MEQRHTTVQAVEAVDLRLPALRLRHIPEDDQHAAMAALCGLKVADVLDTTMVYAMTMLRAQAWTVEEATSWVRGRARETRIARQAMPMRPRGQWVSKVELRQQRRLTEQAKAARTGMVAS